MLNLPIWIMAVLSEFAPVNDGQTTWYKVEVLVAGAILATGKRTVSTVLGVMGLSADRWYAQYHQVLSRAVWSSLEAVDANLWYIVLHYLHVQGTGDVEFLSQHWPIISKALLWLEYQDMNECGLLEIPEAGNWMDLIAVRYDTLYDNTSDVDSILRSAR